MITLKNIIIYFGLAIFTLTAWYAVLVAVDWWLKR